MSVEEVLTKVRELKTLVQKLITLREEDQATIQSMENQIQSLAGKGNNDDDDFDLGNQTVGPEGATAAGKRKEKTPKREPTPVRRGTTAPAESLRSPKISIPDRYDGKSKGKVAKQWWTRMAVCLTFMHDRFANESSEMIWLLQNTKDTAADWAQPLMEVLVNRHQRRTLPAALDSWDSLEQSFLNAFGDPDAGRSAERKIAVLEQSGTTVDYWTEFQTLMADLTWNNSAYRAQFRRGLHWKVKEQLSMLVEPPVDLDELVAAAIRIDNVRRENKLDHTRAKASSSDVRTTTTTTTKATRSPAPSGSPNYVDQAEKDRRKAAGECIKCGRKGHSAKDCRTGWRLSSAKETKTEVKVKKESGKAAVEPDSEGSESGAESGKE